MSHQASLPASATSFPNNRFLPPAEPKASGAYCQLIAHIFRYTFVECRLDPTQSLLLISLGATSSEEPADIALIATSTGLPRGVIEVYLEGLEGRGLVTFTNNQHALSIRGREIVDSLTHLSPRS